MIKQEEFEEFLVFGKFIQLYNPENKVELAAIFSQILEKVDAYELLRNSKSVKPRPIDACDILADCGKIEDGEIPKEKMIAAFMEYFTEKRKITHDFSAFSGGLILEV